ncbi:MAG TPA: hypothetical protein VFX51_15535 [Solirubrobacteraceae bacterium]|nr:hypothetical protein [Solirubrobacteraceae bacterium]
MDLKPHPLISAVVDGLEQRKVTITPVDQLGDLAPPAPRELAASAKARGKKATAPPDAEQDKVTDRALQLAGTALIPALVTFAGFVGATLRRDPSSDATLTVVYLDPQLSSWVLVPTEGIVARDRITDERAPGKERDVVWVTANSSVRSGNGSLPSQAEFLTGEFTRAGDFEASPNGGTMAAATGVFCPGGCKPRTPRS